MKWYCPKCGMIFYLDRFSVCPRCWVRIKEVGQ